MVKVQQEHGGDADQVAQSLGCALQDMLDLSTGISPVPYPAPAIDVVRCQALPTQTQLQRCLAAAKSFYQVPDTLAMMVGPGTQNLLQAIPALAIPKAEVWIPVPSYNEHAPAWQRAGHRVSAAAIFPKSATHAVLVMPNNPTGQYDEGLIEHVADAVRARGGILVLDGAFARPDQAAVLRRFASCAHIIHLRSFGKFFGLAGLRLGFAIGAVGPITALERAAGPWAVSSIALEIGAAALADGPWQRQHLAFLDTQSDRLAQLLGAHGLTLLGGTNLFQTVILPEAHDLQNHLAHAGIWTRKFTLWPDLLRFGVPATDADFSRLDKTLQKWRSQANQ